MIHALFWGGVSLFFEMHPDMVDHWVWSRHLSLSYYEHPPMVALLMRLSTAFVPPVIGLKIGSIGISTFILYLCYKVAETFFNKKTAVITLLILETSPYFSLGSLFWNIDQGYMIFWLLSLLIVHRWIRTRNDQFILLFGVTIGLGMLSKYIAILLYPSVLLWALLSSQTRSLLRKWQTYGALVLTSIIFIPVVIWNQNNNWVSFKMQLGKGFTGNDWGENLLPFTLGYLSLFSLFFSVWALYRSSKNLKEIFSNFPQEKNTELSLLLMTGLFPIFFFSLASLKGKTSEAHWCNTAFFSLFILLAHYISTRKNIFFRFKKVLIASFILNGVAILIFTTQIKTGFLEISRREDRTVELYGWQETSQKVDALIREKLAATQIDYIISREYQLSSVLSLYLKGQPLPHSLEKRERNIWSPVEEIHKGKTSVLVCPTRECVPSNIVEKAEKIIGHKFEKVGSISVSRSHKVIRELQVFVKSEKKIPG